MRTPFFPTCCCVAASLSACIEYDISSKPDDPALPVDTDTGTAPVPSCTTTTLTLGGWRASAPFGTEEGPTDGAGVPFSATAFDDGSWSPLTLPDIGGIPAGQDRAYRTAITIDGTPPTLIMDIQSDDGIEVWIDGTRIGQWGGAWQELGCVNDDANCVEFDIVDPIDVTASLPQGTHTLAMRISNPVEGSYADLDIRCQEPPP